MRVKHLKYYLLFLQVLSNLVFHLIAYLTRLCLRSDNRLSALVVKRLWCSVELHRGVLLDHTEQGGKLIDVDLALREDVVVRPDVVEVVVQLLVRIVLVVHLVEMVGRKCKLGIKVAVPDRLRDSLRIVLVDEDLAVLVLAVLLDGILHECVTTLG